MTDIYINIGEKTIDFFQTLIAALRVIPSALRDFLFRFGLGRRATTPSFTSRDILQG